MESTIEEKLRRLFKQWSGEEASEMLALSANGSNRRYWRMTGRAHQCIATYNADVAENEAFYYYSRALKERGIRVPALYIVDDDRMHYLQQDLGDTTLYGMLFDRKRQGGGFDSEMLGLYRQVLADLAQIQVAGRDMDFGHAYPRSDFDGQSIQWDLNYFKYYFLKLRYIPFNEELLERDFHTFTQYLLDTDCQYFLYRDFQSRNIMVTEGQPYYIDYQGGRRGAAQYDVASLLYSAKSDLPEPVRQDLLNYYIDCLAHLCPIDKVDFRQRFYGYVLVRIMQALGAYGYRGYYERKDYFLGSIPLAIRNLRLVTENHPLPIELPHLCQVWQKIVESEEAQSATTAATGLTVTVTSFSYKKGLPQDPSGNGGGFVFDCRALPNPGRYPEYRCYTGKDQPVIDFLEGDSEVERFLTGTQQLVGASIKKYLERNFTCLTVSFGCTGGQHRSVYCAERMAKWISNNFNCQVVINHREQ